MPLTLKDTLIDELASRLSAQRGVTKTKLIRDLLEREALDMQDKVGAQSISERLIASAERIAQAPMYDDLPLEKIIGYDENGLPS